MYNSFLKIHQNFAAALSYTLGPATGLFFFIGEGASGNNNKFVKFHALQSTVLLGAFMVLSAAIQIIYNILWYIPIIGWIGAVLVFAAKIIFFAVYIYLIVSAFSGKELKMPIIGEICYEQAMK